MKLYYKYRNFIIYSLFGFLASIINIMIFNLAHNHLQIDMLIANTLAWFIANSFSFLVNKKLVFSSRFHNWKEVLRESLLFLSQRLLALILDTLIMAVGISYLHFDSLIVKIADQIMVGLVNYFSTQAIFASESSRLAQKIAQYRKK